VSHARRLAAIERLLDYAACGGACPRCCRPAGPGHLTPQEQRAEVDRVLAEAGLALVPVADLTLPAAERDGP
jgi:hypothetical protein